MSLNLDGELLKFVIDYIKITSKIDHWEKLRKTLKKEIITEMKREGKENDKLKSQLYSLSYKYVESKKVSTKKLKEILYAKDLGNIYEECEYDSKYDQIYVRKRKGGENLF